jgi:hypothetical protein
MCAYIKLLLGLGEARAVYGIYNEDDSVHAGSEVVSPQLSRCITPKRNHSTP